MTPSLDEKALVRRYPVLSAFGASPKRLTAEDEAIASFDDRIGSIWHFIAKKVLSFVETLRPRERANYDPEDLLMELFCKLQEKDGKWSPGRGRYITFAGAVIERELSSLRDKARTVISPRNATGRMKEYQAEADAGTITGRRDKTFQDIRRTVAPTEPVQFILGVASDPEPPAQAVESEHGKLIRDAVVQSMRVLTLFEARVVGETHGLWGKPARTNAQIAERAGKTEGEVRRAKARANEKMRARLTEMNHPAVMTDE